MNEKLADCVGLHQMNDSGRMKLNEHIQVPLKTSSLRPRKIYGDSIKLRLHRYHYQNYFRPGLISNLSQVLIYLK